MDLLPTPTGRFSAIVVRFSDKNKGDSCHDSDFAALSESGCFLGAEDDLRQSFSFALGFWGPFRAAWASSGKGNGRLWRDSGEEGEGGPFAP